MKTHICSQFIAVISIYLISLSPASADTQSVADVVERMVDATRSTYDSLVVKKLENNGAGASNESSTRPGFVPETEAFLRRVAFDAIAKSKRSSDKGFVLAFAPGGQGELTVKLSATDLSVQDEAIVVAKILDRMMRSIRGTYTAMIVRKLQKDGGGASIDYVNLDGFVPLPAVFVRNIATVALAGQAASDKQFTLSLRSRWNLNPGQSLQDDFEREGWAFLVNQQSTRTASGQSMRNFNWSPYVKWQNDGGLTMLRYLSADTAGNQSCVACHNAWETRNETKALRTNQGIEVGKVFALHELMGAVSISVSTAAINQD